MANSSLTQNQFTPEEQARIDAALKEYKEKVRQDEIDVAIRNQIFAYQSQQPGYRYC